MLIVVEGVVVGVDDVSSYTFADVLVTEVPSAKTTVMLPTLSMIS